MKKEIKNYLISTIDTCTDCVAMTDIKGNLIYLNNFGYELTGITNIESVDLFSLIQLKPGEKVSIDGIISILNKNGNFSAGGQIINTKTNEKIDIQISSSLSTKDQKHITFIIKDIRQIKKHHQEITENEKNYYTLIQHAPLGLLIIKNGIIILINPALINLLGYTSEEELLGKPIIEFIHPEFHELAKQRIRKLNSLDDYVLETLEEKFIKKDGSIIDVVVMGQSIQYHGERAIQGYIYDITDRKNVEVLLNNSELKYRGLIESATDAIVGIDHLGLINVWNKSAEKIFGYTSEEILGKPVHQMITSEIFREKADKALKKYLINGEGSVIGTTIEITGLHKNGKEFPVELSLSSNKTLKGWEATGIIRDISKRKKLEEQFSQAQKMESIGRLTGGIAHDFNNILSVIIGYSEMTLNKLAIDDPLYKYTSTILDSANRAASLTAQLLAFSRKQIISPRKTNVNTVIKNIEQMLKRVIGENIELKTFLQDSIPLIKIDKNQLDQVILNLAVNAKDAMPHSGKLTIETTFKSIDKYYVKNHITGKTGDYVVISISDNGSGIDPKIKEKIFEPFFTTKGTGKGTGLGLSTVYGIVKQNDGFIWVYSEPDQGTTFKIYFPAIQGEAEQNKKTFKDYAADIVHGTILIVEDEAYVRELIVEMLSTTNYTIIESGDVDKALEIINNKDLSIDLMITDVVMPKLDGKSLADQCRKIRSDIQVLFMSGYTENVIIHHGILDAGLYFIQKPFTMQTLLDKIRDIFSK